MIAPFGMGQYVLRREQQVAPNTHHRADEFIFRTVASNTSLAMLMWLPRSAESARQRCRMASVSSQRSRRSRRQGLAYSRPSQS
jgi:hypothetical protein